MEFVINNKARLTHYNMYTNIQLYKNKVENHILEEMKGLKFSVNAKSFYQTNSDQAYELYKITRDFAGLSGNADSDMPYIPYRYNCAICF